MENTAKRGDNKIDVAKVKNEPAARNNLMDGLEVIDEDGIFE